MLSMLGGIIGDSAVQRAQREWAKSWMWKHPSPWDWMFFMNNALKQDLGWFWNAWLFGTESVDGAITDVKTAAGKTTVTVKQNGQMPSPVVLEVRLNGRGAPARSGAGGAAMTRVIDDSTVVLTTPVDVWFDGRRSRDVAFQFGGRTVKSVTLDPCGRFPDRDVSDNVWPRADAPRGNTPAPAYCTELYR
jgi:hypothetical protein